VNTTYLSAAETAKLVRAALKRNFPSVTFSVRSKTYSGGASIDVSWTDGPTSRLVDSVVGPYRGGDFDGMIDMKITKDHWLMPDGSASIAHNPGTHGSMGMIAPQREWMPHPDAKLVSFGADFIFTHRKVSLALATRVLERMKAKGYQTELLKLSIEYDGSAYVSAIAYDQDSQSTEHWVREAINRFVSIPAASREKV
jgi:hypothetical protein